MPLVLDHNKINSKIKELRKERSGEVWAKFLGISPPHLKRYESSKESLTYYLLVSQECKVSSDWLLWDRGQKEIQVEDWQTKAEELERKVKTLSARMDSFDKLEKLVLQIISLIQKPGNTDTNSNWGPNNL